MFVVEEITHTEASEERRRPPAELRWVSTYIYIYTVKKKTVKLLLFYNETTAIYLNSILPFLYYSI